MYNASMFESIQKSLDKNKQSGSSMFRNLLQLEANKTYVVRLLPNIKNLEDTFMHYYHHGWKSVKTGQYTSLTSPSTWGDRCPISELYFKIQRDGTEEEKARAKELLKRKENWYVNVLVVNDPTKPENNGTVKVLRYGRQLDKIIQSAMNGDDAEEFGPKIFDLSDQGCNLRIKVELVSDKPGAPKFQSYTASKFLNPSAIEGMTDEKQQEIYNGIFDLNSFIEHKTPEEIQEFIQSHYYNVEGESAAPTKKIATLAAEDPEDEIPMEMPKATPVTKTPVATTKSSVVQKSDDAVMNILDELDNVGKL